LRGDLTSWNCGRPLDGPGTPTYGGRLVRPIQRPTADAIRASTILCLIVRRSLRVGPQSCHGREVSAVIPEVDIWRSALAMVKRYHDDAMQEAAMRADHLLEDGDWRAAITWHRILDAIERLQAQKPAEGENVH
jgi:hypothetical protein